ncbi:hypothetical protein [Clostridium beijerinckii]|uniref:Uncharacterized protein n=1 Tax=Clostridium beijerinckii TaxID=1520 RepID=A0AAW3WA16_CLOBE|nr:hypothetical protein [Clostridium beijerinckii]MBC2458273.1 hypothetical protein [Clostridium beijerinckii]MBC2475561.1 hypothetical protein [Clostridium beijerinckii]NOV60789.1 hypothetical protein [Clostridium beijerinckii]NOV73121.1 hypothetical protein [Clostridium beijerinckii]NOW33351.1 hypothetical protein [Clostridium beijerinckii]
MNLYYTEVDIEKCKKRIDNMIMSERLFPDGLRGEVDFYNNKFYIRKKKANFHSAFERVFYGEFIKKENGTVIQGEFNINFAIQIFTGIWFGILAVVWVITLILYLSNRFLGTLIEFSSGFSGGLIGPPLMALIGGVMIGSSFEMYENEENYVFDLIKSILEANEVQNDSI